MFKDRIELVKEFHQVIHGIEYDTARQVVSIGLPTPDRVRLACSEWGGGLPPHRQNHGKFRMVGPLAPDDATRWYVELLPRDGEGDATVPSTVANGSRSGYQKAVIEVKGVPHADMLVDTVPQWAIAESIRTDLNRLITECERSLRK